VEKPPGNWPEERRYLEVFSNEKKKGVPTGARSVVQTNGPQIGFRAENSSNRRKKNSSEGATSKSSRLNLRSAKSLEENWRPYQGGIRFRVYFRQKGFLISAQKKKQHTSILGKRKKNQRNDKIGEIALMKSIAQAEKKIGASRGEEFS